MELTMDEKHILHSTVLERTDGTKYSVSTVRSGCCEVYLISHMEYPGQMLARVTRTYSGELSQKFVRPDEIDKYVDDLLKTKLATPLEMLYFVFLIKNVSRALTHQLVRTRIASYAQESMRFLGKKSDYYILASGLKNRNLASYHDSCVLAVEEYESLLERGVSSENARGILPTNILTSIFVGISMKSLAHVYEQRMCCQAQPGEWQPILVKMKETIVHKCGTKIASLLSAPYERGEPCGYRASFDRPCVWSNKDAK